MPSYSFEAVLIRPEGVGTWTYLNIPRDISAIFASRGQVRVKGTINGYSFRTTALPRGDGTHYLVVGKSIRDQILATQGDTVKVILEPDSEERQVVIPEDLKEAFISQPQAKDVFETLSNSHKKEYVNWILSAKQVDTRQRRIEKTLGLLLQGKKLRRVRPIVNGL
jgi:hypothetical protein